MGKKTTVSKKAFQLKTYHLQLILAVNQMNCHKFVKVLHHVANAISCSHQLNQLTKSGVIKSTDQQTIFRLKICSLLFDFPPKAHSSN